MIDLKLDLEEQFLIFTLREFNSILRKESYLIKGIVINGIKDEGDSIYFESFLKHKFGFEIALRLSSLFSKRIYITLSRPRGKLLGLIGERELISLDSVVKEIDDLSDLPDTITENNLLMTLQGYKGFIQHHLMPVIKGEMWIDELINQKK